MRVDFTAQALDDIEAQRGWLLQYSDQASARAAQAINAVLQLLRDHPQAGVEIGDGQREMFVEFGRDGFVIRYTPTSDALRVHRVFHGRQDRSRE